MLAIFQYDFMIRAFVVGITVGVIAPVIGLFLIVKRYSLFADTLSHVSLLGVAIGLIANTQPVITAVVFAVLGAIGIDKVQERTKIFGESVLALFLSGSLAVATVLISISGGFNVNLLNFLFGSITTVEPTDLYFITALGATVLITVFLLYKELFFISYDEEAARISGLPVGVLGTILIVLAAVTVSLSIRIVGVLLIGALMVIPGITAMQFKQSFRTTMIYAIGLSVLSVILGLFLSFYVGIASGGSIVVIALILFLLAIIAR
ncbi:MAG: metal ABC transporter permease [Candidatus Aquicultor secundus]|uniref:Metal ABC transporter permease n=1 Tax=Candidatus Aquicultor secundus TaxID=1973895 RepID=A0A2M7T7M9_9ACTN|nr:metal ABC transporter permease [Candidatus Aquicultor secundus]NCO65348.1 metal ABC transporter permease [Solirubrobacter sp.]OIO88803.1 MAG: metal ABC transporter permease [Candidatus Aquicultor secundus]PIU26650.1 MAG: metal ABC transporter permease [Candidatus Aquicultor secundus]PIW21757.1 MAG: metal ABC transporter permease [Candidatus Aquicultor secundus]PIX52164.1 MAG: metal ABC transporter permease [Candidatus Aquicultor secundus]